ncbi:MAG: DinB family protein [Bacteroidota bacterium]
MPAARLQKILQDLAPRLAQEDEQAFGQPSGPGKWSKRQILGHLIDSAYNNHQRFLRGQRGDALVFQGYQQNEWVTLNRYHNRSSKEVINTFLVVQEHLAHMLSRIPAEVLNKPISQHNYQEIAMRSIDEKETVSLGLLIEDYLYHLLHHIRQLYPDFEAEWYLGYRESTDHRLNYNKRLV